MRTDLRNTLDPVLDLHDTALMSYTSTRCPSQWRA